VELALELLYRHFAPSQPLNCNALFATWTAACVSFIAWIVLLDPLKNPNVSVSAIAYPPLIVGTVAMFPRKRHELPQ
jgi:hypothetical protein